MNAAALKDSFRKRGVVLGTWVFEFDSPGIARLLASTGVDFVIYDMEHSGFGIESIRRLISQTRPLNLAALVRPPASENHLIGPVLDVGADGIIVPKVEDAAQAAKIVDACRYYPEGHRGAAFSVAHDDFLPGNVSDKIKAANSRVLCGLLIETAEGLKNVEEIVSVPGVDLVWVGFLDLSISMEIPGQFEDPRFKMAIKRILNVCESRGIPVGILAKDAQQSVQYVHQGFRCISYSGDIWLLQDALSQGVKEIRRCLESEPSQVASGAGGTHPR